MSSVEQLISDGVKAIAYIPFEDTPKDNSKAVFHWDKRPELTVETELKPKHNIAIKPDFKWVDIDFDCDEAKQLMNGYFNPTYLFGISRLFVQRYSFQNITSQLSTWLFSQKFI